ncbi:MAG: DUF3732 domain-containing protein [Cellulosilyticaceae bacterium]
MKFYYCNLIMWTKNGNVRELTFQPNKVNIITGGCETGKSTILAIIDYCFFASGHNDSGEIKIPQTIINENVEWYGVRFNINNKKYTLARRALEGENKPRNEYYFSGTGEIPNEISSNMGEKEIKEILNEEFSIDNKIVIPYNGSKIKMGTKVSLRYFMLFNSQDENTITNTDVFFDKQTILKYQEALSRVFDIAIGISSPKDILISEKIKEIESELNKYEKKQNIAIKSQDIFKKERLEIIQQAQAYGILTHDQTNDTDAIQQLKEVITGRKITEDLNFEKIQELDKEERKISQQISNIKRFLKTYDEYKVVLASNEDSLKPLMSIKKYLPNTVDNPLVSKIILGLEKELIETKAVLKREQPSNYVIKQKLSELQKGLAKVQNTKERYERNEGVSQADRYMFLGEVKNKLKFYDNPVEYDDYAEKISSCEADLEELKNLATDKAEHKEAIIRLLEGNIKELLDQCSGAMDTYKGFLPIFNYSKKKLELQKPMTTDIIKVAGSSSNALFLHLCLMLGIHEIIINQQAPYVASYLILDQPSRPYYDNQKEECSDRQRIIKVMQLLNDYINRINDKYEEEFQIIVVEHIMPEIWEGMENVHLVEEFIGGNKLIRKEDIS